MKNLTLLIILLFFVQSCKNESQKVNKSIMQSNKFHSDKIRDSIFENVIEITDADVMYQGTNYIFNVTIPEMNETPILYVSTRVPQEILSRIYPNFQSLIVISPNWNYYDEVSKELGASVSYAEPRTSTIIYEFNREGGIIKKDSIIMMDTFPEIKFKTTTK
ncbi:hypothetical protein [Flavobacterium algicola]|uniref:hypothetical protein n=1 Tax=Flavobacterium algicola TaxID=556529 RepID=UPI001EFEA159|nr:hypothetical protein [Flavobacterium algicola]MCG9791209.1 hypothetical protein [Flavobacterium algicola]